MHTRERLILLACAAALGCLLVQQALIVNLREELRQATHKLAASRAVNRRQEEPGAPRPVHAGPSVGESDETRQLAEARKRIEQLRGEVAALRAATSKNGAADEEEPFGNDSDTGPTLAEFRNSLNEVTGLGIAAFSSPKTAELVKKARILGQEAIVEIGAVLLESQDATARFAAAAILEKLGDPAAIAVLSQSLGTESDRLVRRMASHAIALIGDEAGIAALQKLDDDSDIGVRINAAFGLAKVKAPGGLKAYQSFYDSPDTDEFLKVAMLGGFTLLKDPDAVPFLERVYFKSDDLKTKIIVVAALGETPGEQSADLLTRIIASEPEDSVFEAAQKAYKASTGLDPQEP